MTAARAAGLRFAPLTEADAEAALALSAEAGWNQTAADWCLMLDQGEGVGCFTADGQLIGSALLVPYGTRLAWLAMVLVTARHRRRGIATQLVAERLARADRLGLSVGLDATPAGRPVYRQLGFRDGRGLHRLAAAELRLPPASAAPAAIRPLTSGDLPAAVALDAATFGAERGYVLDHLRAAWPERALVAKHGRRLCGCAFVRRGRVAHHLGPLAAEHPECAAALAARALAGLEGRVVIDVPDAQRAFLAWLGACGFRPERPFTRMMRAAAKVPAEPRRSFAVAGPEFG